eukprot:3694291-Rhodomonas_salina.1
MREQGGELPVCRSRGEVRGKRKRIREHEEEEAVAHGRLMGRRAGREHERIAALEKELEETKLELACERAKCGEARVVWKIEGFTEKAKDKTFVNSAVFRVHTNAGEYFLKLQVDFYREAGSTRHGYCGVFVEAMDGGNGHFPLNLGVTTFTLRKGARMATTTFDDAYEIDTKRGIFGNQVCLRADTIPGLSWTANDTEADPTDGVEPEPEHDVCDFLENDTLT